MTDDAKPPTRPHQLKALSPAQRAVLEERLMRRRRAVARGRRIEPREKGGPVPLSYPQELMWMISQLFADGVAYNAPSAFRLVGDLDLDHLARAFDALIARHEILRTTYAVIGGAPMQVVAKSRTVDLQVHDLSELPRDEREERALAILRADARVPFDLARGPVLRPSAIRLSRGEHILMVNMHHIATDGNSRATMMRELTRLYDEIATGIPAYLAPLPIQYADYAIWQREWVGSEIGSSQLEYWRQTLDGAPSRLDLPTDRPRPAVRSYAGSHLRTSLDARTRQGLHAAARSCDSTMFVAVLAVFAALLAGMPAKKTSSSEHPSARARAPSSRRWWGTW